MSEAQITPEDFQEKYGDFMLDGLNSHSTYIPLKSNKRVGINIAIRPYVFRDSAGVVIFGGKFRVGYTLDSGDYVKPKIVDLHEEDRYNRIKDFCKGFSWQKQAWQRFSTVVGFGVAAGPYDSEVIDKVMEQGLALKLLNQLESKYSQYNEEQTFNAKRKAAAALADAWYLQAQHVFNVAPEVTKMPAGVLGATSKLLNKGQESYTDNVVSFSEKVAALKNAE